MTRIIQSSGFVGPRASEDVDWRRRSQRIWLERTEALPGQAPLTDLASTLYQRTLHTYTACTITPPTSERLFYDIINRSIWLTTTRGVASLLGINHLRTSVWLATQLGRRNSPSILQAQAQA